MTDPLKSSQVNNLQSRIFQDRARVARTLACCLLVLLTFVLPIGLSLQDKLLITAIIVVAMPTMVLIEVLAHPDHAVPGVNFAVISFATMAGFITPDIWVPLLIIIPAISLSTIPLETQVASWAMLSCAGAGLALIGWFQEIEDWPTATLVFMVMAAAIEFSYRGWQARNEQTRSRYEVLAATAGIFFWEVDPVTGEVLSVTGNTDLPLGRSIRDVRRTNWFDLLVARQPFDAALRSLAIEGASEGVFANFELVHSNGQPVPFRHRIIRDLHLGVVSGAAMEITELAKAAELIQHQADHDGLTGLLNRSVLLSRLDEVLRSASEEDPVSVLMVDLDRFKEVNDVLGHQVGDEILAVLARRFSALDFVHAAARLGGDEFALVLTGEPAKDASTHAKSLVEEIEQIVSLDRLKLSVSGSVGVATAPQDAYTAEALMVRADVAMYRAKVSNRSVVTFSQSQDLRVDERSTLSTGLTDAFAEHQFEIWFQPKVDLATDRIIGAEGLARWRHPTLGVLAPHRFLQVVSVSGAYEQFTDEVLRQGIEFAARSCADGAPLDVAVNLSAMSFFDHGLADRIKAMLDGYGVDPGQLTLEITETDILDDLSVHEPVFNGLRAIGVDLSIDDFGVGYSSLSRLRRLPIQELKIDRSFVAGLFDSAEDRVIVQAIVDLARILGHRTVAEGVEDSETRDRLREVGCDLAQGFHYSHPIPADEFFERYGSRNGERYATSAADGPPQLSGTL